jgi:ferrous iron transport protein A
MCLTDAEIGATVKITGFTHKEGLRAKLNQYGLYQGDVARVLRAAPFGGPLLIEVGGREIALGKDLAAQVVVEAV